MEGGTPGFAKNGGVAGSNREVDELYEDARRGAVEGSLKGRGALVVGGQGWMVRRCTKMIEAVGVFN